jgi:hypothetical protein
MNERIRELEARLNELEHGSSAVASERVDLLNELSWELSRVDVNRADELSRGASDLAAANGYQKGLAYSLRNRGVCDWLRADYSAALVKLLEAQRLFTSIEDLDGEGTIR